MHVDVVSISWLLQTILQWTQECINLSEIAFSSSLCKYPVMELLDCMAFLFLLFWGPCRLFSIAVVPIYISNISRGFPFLYVLTTLISFFLKMANRTGMNSHLLWLGYGFPWWFAMLSTFSWGCWPCRSSLGKMFIQVFYPFLVGWFGGFNVEL